MMAPPAKVVGSPRGTPRLNQADSQSSVGTPTTWRSPMVRQTAPKGLASSKSDPALEALANAMAWDSLTASVENEVMQRSSKLEKVNKTSTSSLGLCRPRMPGSSASQIECCAPRNGDDEAVLAEGHVETVHSPVCQPVRPGATDLHSLPISNALIDEFSLSTTQSQNLAEEINSAAAKPDTQRPHAQAKETKTAGKSDGRQALTQAEIDEIVTGLKDSPELKNFQDETDSGTKSPTERASPPHSPGRRQQRRSPGRRSPARQRCSGAGQTCGGSPRSSPRRRIKEVQKRNCVQASFTRQRIVENQNCTENEHYANSVTVNTQPVMEDTVYITSL
eukprot:gnl/MRDRNA2_/MRDRNA2_106804_c0_seq1.p1 gnl/MRDRNA2_/MRDRNA2_106804_c0~~gnl/MRDRNA2_/MRDRNA2_106804_c0_seq1.p1  ORF type:complete len:394 (+),score=64.24 gnl/MRDRNA2_/MRDRNA2_106804_c0_seq1:178-1182(+)